MKFYSGDQVKLKEVVDDNPEVVREGWYQPYIGQVGIVKNVYPSYCSIIWPDGVDYFIYQYIYLESVEPDRFNDNIRVPSFDKILNTD